MEHHATKLLLLLNDRNRYQLLRIFAYKRGMPVVLARSLPYSKGNELA
ncbi:MAG TPA: hypothetical protein V6D34_02215 [Candidatus Sericytochromatia bacterium]